MTRHDVSDINSILELEKMAAYELVRTFQLFADEGLCMTSYMERYYQKSYDKLYLIKNKITGYTKIGITGRFWKRKSELEKSAGIELNTLIVADFGKSVLRPYDVEQYLHCYFSAKRVIGEWFRLSDIDVLRVIIMLNQLEASKINIEYHDFKTRKDFRKIEVHEWLQRHYESREKRLKQKQQRYLNKKAA